MKTKDGKNGTAAVLSHDATGSQPAAAGLTPDFPPSQGTATGLSPDSPGCPATATGLSPDSPGCSATTTWSSPDSTGCPATTMGLRFYSPGFPAATAAPFCPSGSDAATAETSVSFTGCGMLFIYQVGVTSCFKQHAPHLLANKLAGCSAGAIVACGALCVSADEMRKCMYMYI